MPPSSEEFAALVEGNVKLADLVSEVLFSGLPYVFENDPKAWESLKSELATGLHCDPNDVCVVGSAKMGYSLAPRKFGRPFAAHSDIDVVVVNAELYDAIWKSVLAWHYRRRNRMPRTDREWIDARRQDFYWGYVNPVGFQYRGLSRSRQLNAAKSISTQWFEAFQSLGQNPAFVTRTVSGRLYRTWDHATLYHDHGLRELRRVIVDGNPEEAN